jgi:thioredoxin-related protein
MKHSFMPLFLLMLLVACSSPEVEDVAQPLASRPIEQMNDREASLLGLDLKDGDPDEGWPNWAGSQIYSMEEAQALAKENGKKVLVEVYAVWCGFCRKMAAETHPTQQVKDAVNELFYLVRVNAESEKEVVFNGETMTEADLAAAFGVSSFPTTVFVDTNGDPLGYQPGFMDANTYTELISYVGTDSFKSTSFEDFVQSRSEQ